jgi:hypothetical protein
VARLHLLLLLLWAPRTRLLHAAYDEQGSNDKAGFMAMIKEAANRVFHALLQNKVRQCTGNFARSTALCFAFAALSAAAASDNSIVIIFGWRTAHATAGPHNSNNLPVRFDAALRAAAVAAVCCCCCCWRSMYMHVRVSSACSRAVVQQRIHTSLEGVCGQL